MYFMIMKKAVRKAGLEQKGYSLHSLRHTFASWLVQDGVKLEVVGQLLGHSSINITMRYAHLAPSQAKSAVNLISEKLE